MVKATFLAAKDGKIVITLENTEGLEPARTIEVESSDDIAFLKDLVDFSDAFASSSMDFANEYGFPYPSAAWDMLERGLEAA